MQRVEPTSDAIEGTIKHVHENTACIQMSQRTRIPPCHGSMLTKKLTQLVNCNPDY